MNCLEGLIGIKNTCEYGNSTSGLFINNLPGISVKSADASISEEDISGVQLLKDKIDFAVVAVTNHFRNAISENIKIKTVISKDVAGAFQDYSKLAASNKTKGIKLKMCDYPYMEFYLQSFSLNIDYTGDLDVTLYDLLTGNIVDVFSVSTIANETTNFLVNKTYFTNKQKMVYALVYSDIYGSHKTTLNRCGSCRKNYKNNYIEFEQVQTSSTQFIESNFTSANDTAGLSLEYSVSCSLDRFICTIGKQLAWSILYKAGAEIMQEFKYSRRLNSIISIDRSNHDELYTLYENEYMSSLQALCNNIKLPNDACFSCNSTIRKTTQIP